ncbi:MAG: DciA family protein [Bergeyella zoohelcum]|nr:DciA family protein [Bergeyella zoohelcum]
MKPRKRREYQASELVKSMAKIYGFEQKMKALEIKDFMQNDLSATLFNEIESVNLDHKTLSIKLKSPLAKLEFQMQRTAIITKINEEFGKDTINLLLVL